MLYPTTLGLAPWTAFSPEICDLFSSPLSQSSYPNLNPKSQFNDGDGKQVRIFERTGFTRALKNPYIWRITLMTSLGKE